MYASFSLADFDVQVPCLDDEGTVDVQFQTRDETVLSGPVQDVLSLDLPGSHEVRTTAIGWSGGFRAEGDQSDVAGDGVALVVRRLGRVREHDGIGRGRCVGLQGDLQAAGEPVGAGRGAVVKGRWASPASSPPSGPRTR